MIYMGKEHECSASLDMVVDFRAELERLDRMQDAEVLVEHVAIPLADLNALLQ